MSLKGIRKSDGTAEYIYADDTLSEENAPGEAKAAGDRIAGVEGRVITLETAAPEIISNATKSWLDDNVTPAGSAVAIDSSLTQSGLAADAKAAGDAVNDLKSDLKSDLIETTMTVLDGAMTPTTHAVTDWVSGWVRPNGTLGPSNIVCRTGFINFGSAIGFVPFTVKSGYSIQLNEYTTASVSSFIGRVGEYQTLDYRVNIDPSHYYVITIQRNDNAEFTPADIPSDVLSYISYAGAFDDEVSELHDEINALNDSVDDKLKTVKRTLISPSKTVRRVVSYDDTISFSDDTENVIISRVDGASKLMLQYTENGDFRNADNWRANENASLTVSDGVCTLLATNQNGNVRQIFSGGIVGHKYMAVVDLKSESPSANVGINIFGGYIHNEITITNTWQRYFAIGTLSAYFAFGIAILDRRSSDYSNIYIKNAMLFDLTDMKLASSVNSYDDFKELYPNEYYKTNFNGITSNNFDTATMISGGKTTTYSLPASIKNLDSVGFSSGDASNIISFEDGAYIQKVKAVKIKDIAWGGTSQSFSSTIIDNLKLSKSNSEIPNITCCALSACSYYDVFNLVVDKSITVTWSYDYYATGGIRIYDSSCDTKEDFLARYGEFYICYELRDMVITPIDGEVQFLASGNGTISFNGDTNYKKCVDLVANSKGKLLFFDDFNNATIDGNKWDVKDQASTGATTNINYISKDNVSIENGCAVLALKKDTSHGTDFTSSSISTTSKFEFCSGCELSAKVKFQNINDGVWLGIWTSCDAYLSKEHAPWPYYGELDLIEIWGNASSGFRSESHIHYGVDSAPVISSQHIQTGINYNDSNWHILTLKWLNDSVAYLVDGEVIALYDADELINADGFNAFTTKNNRHSLRIFIQADSRYVTENTPEEMKILVDWVKCNAINDDDTADYIKLLDDAVTVSKGSEFRLISVTDNSSCDKTVIYEISDENIVERPYSDNNTNTFYAKETGVATVTVRNRKGNFSKCIVTVEEEV